ncbi:MAG: type III-A CRISPR-associated RAMP protein Csm3 [Epsilonproteobacteria bacterium]|nr:type III-A CRISPR-associated RAMP protein Csm3 [Campylobacterota bacterium]
MEIRTLRGRIKVQTGLHIGAGDDTMRIGGIDNPVIKDPNTRLPYIPGSSLKGKMRSLLEWNLGLVGASNGEPFAPRHLRDGIFSDKERLEKALLLLLKVFGCTITKEDEQVLKEREVDLESNYLGITRIGVADAFVREEIKKGYEDGKIELVEAKYENMIDRCRGTATNPRQTERVPGGVEFEFCITYKVLPNDKAAAEIKELITKGIELVEQDYLGGNGSRGYGRVKFQLTNW